MIFKREFMNQKVAVRFGLGLLLFFNSFCVPPKVSLIWQYNRANAWEQDWLMELLSGLDIEVYDDTQFILCKNNSIIVVAADQEKKLVPYLMRLKRLGCKFGVILLYDENYAGSTDFYEYPLFIFKNYWHKQYAPYNHVHCFLLGYKSGFWSKESQKIVNAEQRKYNWSFVGQIVRKYKPEEKIDKNYQEARINMCKAMRTIPHNFVYAISGWNAPKSLKVPVYQDVLLDSIFVPCPRGHWNLDSYRLCEALECGCIPIVETEPIDYYKKFLGDHPFITVSSWDEAPGQVAGLLADPVSMEIRRQECANWWLEYKKKTNLLFVQTIKKAFDLE